MIINKNSWHYRLASSNNILDVPKNLCPYVRVVLFKSIILLFGIFVSGFIFTVIGTGIVIKFGLSGILFWVSSFICGLIAVVAIIGFVVGAVIGTMFIHEKWKERKNKKKLDIVNARISAGLYPEPPKSLMREWLDAKHDKICPTLEFNNDKY